MSSSYDIAWYCWTYKTNWCRIYNILTEQIKIQIGTDCIPLLAFISNLSSSIY